MSTVTQAEPPAGVATLESGMTHRQVLQAMSGLLLGMFVAILSSTVVTTALPEIIGDLGGSQSSYTWVVTSTLLALTVSTPIWGKLADLFDRKLLVQTGLVIYVSGSLLAGLSQTTTWLIACRVIQGLGVGGLTALVQVILSDLVSPRERGRYSGYLGAVFGLGTVAGPLLGGFITDGLGWRWCFYVGVPFAVAAFVALQRNLNLPRRRREVSIDFVGRGADRRGCLEPAHLGVARGPAVRLAVLADRRPRGRRARVLRGGGGGRAPGPRAAGAARPLR